MKYRYTVECVCVCVCVCGKRLCTRYMYMYMYKQVVYLKKEILATLLQGVVYKIVCSTREGW